MVKVEDWSSYGLLNRMDIMVTYNKDYAIKKKDLMQDLITKNGRVEISGEAFNSVRIYLEEQ